jgi:hypothetical protein
MDARLHPSATDAAPERVAGTAATRKDQDEPAGDDGNEARFKDNAYDEGVQEPADKAGTGAYVAPPLGIADATSSDTNTELVLLSLVGVSSLDGKSAEATPSFSLGDLLGSKSSGGPFGGASTVAGGGGTSGGSVLGGAGGAEPDKKAEAANSGVSAEQDVGLAPEVQGDGHTEVASAGGPADRGDHEESPAEGIGPTAPRPAAVAAASATAPTTGPAGGALGCGTST